MSTRAKQTTPNHCYCRVQDEEVNLNEIAKIITVLNLKILRLRNEVSALKNVSSNGDKKLYKKTEPAYEDLSSLCCDKEFNASRSNIKLDKFMVSEESKALANFFENNSTNNCTTKYKQIKDEILNAAADVNNFFSNEKLQITDRKLVFENELKKRKNKISQGIQCDLVMERKRKRIFLNCFKTEPHIKEQDFLKPTKKMKLSSKNNIHNAFEFDKEDLRNSKEQDEEIFQLETYVRDEENVAREKIDRICKLIKIEPKEKFQETKTFKSEWTENEHEMDLANDNEDGRQLLKCSINRMGGGAEIRGNRLISDFQDKIQKINLFKNVKFDAKNVKRRLDACIDQLNGIIEDVSLILPSVDLSKELQK